MGLIMLIEPFVSLLFSLYDIRYPQWLVHFTCDESYILINMTCLVSKLLLVPDQGVLTSDVPQSVPQPSQLSAPPLASALLPSAPDCGGVCEAAARSPEQATTPR